MRRMPKFLVLAAVGIIVIAGYAMCNAGNSIATNWSDPVSVTEDAVWSLETRDMDRACSYYTGIAQVHMSNRCADLWTKCESLDIRDVTASIQLQGETIARVFIGYSMDMSSYGNTNTQRFDKVVQLARVGDKWYLTQVI